MQTAQRLRPLATLYLALLAIALAVQVCMSAHNLEEEYRFSAILDDGYTLYWNFDLEQQTIAFAVNVSTRGWVGFGLSPNGQMPQSDVVIGWVDINGNTQFHDRFAVDRFLPPIDESQDWFLVSGEEEDGHTILEFTRNIITCDDNDLDIKADTSRVVWAYHSLDPVSVSSLGSLRHQRKGSASLNLLGGSNNDRVVNNTDSFVIANENLLIPDKDTTYWCSVYDLPDEVKSQEKHIIKFGPVISTEATRYVHHIIVYLCSNLNHTHVGASSECENANIDIGLCRGGGIIIAAWAVGGEDFVYPEDVAYPIGGEGNAHYVILEMHYDNPNTDSGVLDTSGVRFTYTEEPQKHRAGILTSGFTAHSSMIIPPGRSDYKISGLCPGECTKHFFPPEGITVFGSLLHTHVTGHGLIVRQYRQNDECSVLEELEPIDENRRYDFNYQQITHLPSEVKILPGDSIHLECFYRTTSVNNVTLGGESTREEMCFTFLLYYPQVDLSFCICRSPFQSYEPFAQQHIDPSLHDTFFSSLHSNNAEGVRHVLDQVEWTEEASTMMEDILNNNIGAVCLDSKNQSNSVFVDAAPPPVVQCPYKAPDTCTDTPVQSCCESLDATTSDSASLRCLPLLMMLSFIFIITLYLG